MSSDQEEKVDDSGTRVEYDSMGEVLVPIESYYGAQTKRSLDFFSISSELMPLQIIKVEILRYLISVL